MREQTADKIEPNAYTPNQNAYAPQQDPTPPVPTHNHHKTLTFASPTTVSSQSMLLGSAYAPCTRQRDMAWSEW